MEKQVTNGNDPISVMPTEVQIGLTKREYFAGLAMQGLISRAPIGHLGNSVEGAQLAAQWADDLIKELSK